jgi:hypothetical protein
VALNHKQLNQLELVSAENPMHHRPLGFDGFREVVVRGYPYQSEQRTTGPWAARTEVRH